MRNLDPSRYIWTARHYRPYLAGSVLAALYAWVIRHLAQVQHIQLEEWVVPVTAQAALWLGIWFGRLMWFK